jgi:hypothetical protein
METFEQYNRKQVIVDRATTNLKVLEENRTLLLEELYKLDQQILRHKNLINELEQVEL